MDKIHYLMNLAVVQRLHCDSYIPPQILGPQTYATQPFTFCVVSASYSYYTIIISINNSYQH